MDHRDKDRLSTIAVIVLIVFLATLGVRGCWADYSQYTYVEPTELRPACALSGGVWGSLGNTSAQGCYHAIPIDGTLLVDYGETQ